MKILSWDVGIYNLSYCILEKIEDSPEIKIIDWDIVNLVDNEELKKNRNLLFENIPRKLHEKPQLLNVDVVVIENQPSLKNPQMKSIQMILYSYFLILGKVIGNGDKSTSYIDKIDFCSASNKLKIYDGPPITLEEKKKRASTKKDKLVSEEVKIEEKNNNDIIKPIENKKKSSAIKYGDKKKLAIEHAKYFLSKDNSNYYEFFMNHKKKDDLSDSFLQGLYYIKVNNKQ
jgi:hypothetical protein